MKRASLLAHRSEQRRVYLSTRADTTHWNFSFATWRRASAVHAHSAAFSASARGGSAAVGRGVAQGLGHSARGGKRRCLRDGLRCRVRELPKPLAALHRRTQEAPHHTAVDRRLGGCRRYRPGHRKDHPVKSPFPNDVCWPTMPVCWFTSIVCSGAPDVRNRLCAECNLPADVRNGTNGTDSLACVVCTVTQAVGRFSYGYCGPTNIVRGPTKVVCGAVWPRFSQHFPICRPYDSACDEYLRWECESFRTAVRERVAAGEMTAEEERTAYEGYSKLIATARAAIEAGETTEEKPQPSAMP